MMQLEPLPDVSSTDWRPSRSSYFSITWQDQAERQRHATPIELQVPLQSENRGRKPQDWFGAVVGVLGCTAVSLILGSAALEAIDGLVWFGHELSRYRFEDVLRGIVGR